MLNIIAMQQLKHISADQLEDYHQKLKQFSDMDEFTIRDIWKLSDDPTVDDLSNLKYHWNLPLYQKMILSYWQCDRIASKFYRVSDDSNQQRLLRHFNMDWKEFDDYIEFFAWISNGLAIYEINQMDSGGVKDYKTSEYVQKWKKNDVDFFFWLPVEQKTLLVKRYNKECVDRFNAMINRDHADDIYYYT